MAKRACWREIPTELSLARFEEFILPHLTVGSRGPAPKLSLHALFNYILKLLYLGCQWKELPIEKDATGRRVIHHVRIWRTFRRWVMDGCFTAIFEGTVLTLNQAELLDVSIIHGDGTTTAAKKGGDNIGFNGHKKIKGDKVVAFCDRNCNVIAPFISAPGNRNELPLLRDALPAVTRIAGSIGLDLRGTIVSLDGAYDCPRNRKAIFNRGMVPNINPNPRNRQSTKRGRKPLFDAAIFRERFNTIERVFGWEDKFRHLLLRFERISELHYLLLAGLTGAPNIKISDTGRIAPSRVDKAHERDFADATRCHLMLIFIWEIISERPMAILMATRPQGIRSTHCAREGPGSNGSPKYCVS